MPGYCKGGQECIRFCKSNSTGNFHGIGLIHRRYCVILTTAQIRRHFIEMGIFLMLVPLALPAARKNALIVSKNLKRGNKGMKRKILSLVLALVLFLGLTLPASAALRTIEEMKPDEVRTIATDGGATGYSWSSSDPLVATCTNNDSPKSIVTAKKPGTAVITVTCTRQKPDLIVDPITKKPVATTTTYVDRDTCTIVVKDPAAPTPPRISSLPAPSKSYGSAGDDVSGIITDIRGFNCGVVPVKYNELWGLADAELKLLTPFQFTSIGTVTDSGYLSVRLDGKAFVINTKGEVVYAHSASTSKDTVACENGYIRVKRVYDTSSSAFKNEYYNYKGEQITYSQANDLEAEWDNRLEALGTLIYDRPKDGDNGKTVWLFCLPTDRYEDNPATAARVPAYDGCDAGSSIQEGLLVVSQRYDIPHLCGAVDKDGKLVIPCEYDVLYASSGGWLAYKQGNRCGLLKNPVNPPSETAAAPADSSPAKPSTTVAPAKPVAPSVSSSSDFTIENGVLTKYNGKGGNVTIPDTVTEIGEKAFYECMDLTSVVMPDTVEKIGERAFYGCWYLNSVKVSSSLREIGESAFWRCNALTSFEFPDSIREVRKYAFKGCRNLTSASFPVGLERISEEAFYGCQQLKSVTIHSKTVDLGRWVFGTIDDHLQRVPIPGLTITAPEGSTTEAYCKENGLSFKPLA